MDVFSHANQLKLSLAIRVLSVCLQVRKVSLQSSLMIEC